MVHFAEVIPTHVSTTDEEGPSGATRIPSSVALRRGRMLGGLKKIWLVAECWKVKIPKEGTQKEARSSPYPSVNQQLNPAYCTPDPKYKFDTHGGLQSFGFHNPKWWLNRYLFSENNCFFPRGMKIRKNKYKMISKLDQMSRICRLPGTFISAENGPERLLFSIKNHIPKCVLSAIHFFSPDGREP